MKFIFLISILKIEIFSMEDSLIALDQTNPHEAVNHGVAMYQDNLLVFGGSIAHKENGRCRNN